MDGRLVVAAPLHVEAAAVASAWPAARVVRSGFGRGGALQTAERLAEDDAARRGLVVAGTCAAVSDTLRPGDVVLADHIDDGRELVAMPPVGLLERELRRRGLRVHRGTVRTVERILGPADRRALSETGAIAVDMESTWLLSRPLAAQTAVVRCVVEPAERGLISPWVALDAARGLHALRECGKALGTWGRALAGRTVLLAEPRSYCAGVERAIDIVRLALQQRGAPIYVRKQIVHNTHVVESLRQQGAIFVEELADVPRGATVIFSAHGVSPAVRAEAAERGLHVIDATCPLVAKVHAEARRFVARGDNVVLIGHAGHEEVEGTMGEAPGLIHLVEDAGDVDALELDGDRPVTYLTQTTLGIDDTRDVIAHLGERFTSLAPPPADDICYATHNRQRALTEVARRSDLVLVVGSETSSNSKRLVEVAEREGTPAELIDDERGIDLRWLAGVETVGVTAGASAPEHLVRRVIAALAELGPLTVEDSVLTSETVHFRLPREVR